MNRDQQVAESQKALFESQEAERKRKAEVAEKNTDGRVHVPDDAERTRLWQAAEDERIAAAAEAERLAAEQVKPKHVSPVAGRHPIAGGDVPPVVIDNDPPKPTRK